MKRTFLFAAVLICALSAKGQSVRKIEDSMVYYSNGIQRYSAYNEYDSSIDFEAKFDSLIYFNDALLGYL